MYRNLLLDEDSQVDAIKTRIKKSWPKVVGIPCDVSKSEDVQALSEAAVREFGNIDIWVGTSCELLLTFYFTFTYNCTLSKFCVKVAKLENSIFGFHFECISYKRLHILSIYHDLTIFVLCY